MLPTARGAGSQVAHVAAGGEPSFAVVLSAALTPRVSAASATSAFVESTVAKPLAWRENQSSRRRP